MWHSALILNKCTKTILLQNSETTTIGSDKSVLTNANTEMSLPEQNNREFRVHRAGSQLIIVLYKCDNVIIW